MSKEHEGFKRASELIEEVTKKEIKETGEKPDLEDVIEKIANDAADVLADRLYDLGVQNMKKTDTIESGLRGKAEYTIEVSFEDVEEGA